MVDIFLILISHLFFCSASHTSPSSNIYKNEKLIYQPKTLENHAATTEILIFTFFNTAIIDDIQNNRKSSPKLKGFLFVLYSQSLKLRNLLSSEEFVLKITPRIEDQPSPLDKLFVRYRQDTKNPWATLIRYEELLERGQNEKVKNFDAMSPNDTLPRFSETSVRRFMNSCLVDERYQMVLSGGEAINRGYRHDIRVSLSKYVAYETERLLCKLAYEKTGVEVNSIEEIHQKLEIDYPACPIPPQRRAIISENLYVTAPFIEFKRKKETTISMEVEEEQLANQQVIQETSENEQPLDQQLTQEIDIIKSMERHKLKPAHKSKRSKRKAFKEEGQTQPEDLYKEKDLVLQPLVSNRLAKATEIITFLNLNLAVIKDFFFSNLVLRREMIFALDRLRIDLNSLITLMIDKDMKKTLLPRISDQPCLFTKIVAKYRIDQLNPWITLFSISYFPEHLKSALNIDYIVRNGGLKCSLERSSDLNESLYTMLKPYLVDNSPLLFPDYKYKEPNDITGKLFMKYYRMETEMLLCRIIHEKFGITVKSFSEINERFLTDLLIPSDKSKLSGRLLYAKAPFIRFEPK